MKAAAGAPNYTAIRLIAFLIGAYISALHVAEYWTVGPVFGLVVLIWHAKSPRDLYDPMGLTFLFASTFIYAIVYWISLRHVPTLPRAPHLLDATFLAVLAGSFLLPQAHMRWLGLERRLAIPTAVTLIVVYYLSGLLLNAVELPGWLSRWVNAVSIWQGTYLCCTFRGGRGKAR